MRLTKLTISYTRLASLPHSAEIVKTYTFLIPISEEELLRFLYAVSAYGTSSGDC